MPRVDLRDAFGTSYQIATLDLELLEMWFHEWLPRLYPPEMPEEYGFPVIAVWPLLEGSRTPDWPAERSVFRQERFTRDPGQAMTALAELRARLEQELADLEEKKAVSHGG